MKRAPTAAREIETPLPLRGLDDPKPAVKPIAATPAPAWVALLAAWLGLVTLLAAGALPLLPGSRNPRAELVHARPYSTADRWLPVPVYLSVTAIFIGCIVLWQMRKEARPLADALLAQRLQAYVGIALAVIGVIIIYAYVHFSIAAKAS